MTHHNSTSAIPPWGIADLPEPKPISFRNWTSFIGPGIVMMGVQIGGGEWLFGPEITARYGGGLMWIASIAILLQVFYNIECGRYALYCGEPVFTGFMRKSPGPMFWMSLMLILNGAALIPGLSTHAAAIIAAFILDRPPGIEDKLLVTTLAYLCLIGVVLPILVGGKIYNMLQGIMTAKVIFVLAFCILIGFLFVDPHNWWNVFSGFLRFGNVPVSDPQGKETVVNAFSYYSTHGTWPSVALANIAVLGAFAGYAGGGGLANSTYSNFVRDKGWGMGSLVGAIPSAVGGRNVSLSHVGKIFPLTDDNLRRWKGWWKYILTDQIIVWGPGCVMGMALPALLSIQFARNSDLAATGLAWSQALITSDGMRHAPQLSPAITKSLWLASLLAGMTVMLPSQMSIVDDFSRRWTDALWTASPAIRRRFTSNQVGRLYYSILALYVFWSFFCALLFSTYGTPKLMTLVIANLNNVALGVTSLQLLWINRTLLPVPLRPRWYHSLGLIACAIFYLGLAALVFVEKQLPLIRQLWSSATA